MTKPFFYLSTQIIYNKDIYLSFVKQVGKPQSLVTFIDEVESIDLQIELDRSIENDIGDCFDWRKSGNRIRDTKQADGCQWVKIRYGGIEGQSQADTKNASLLTLTDAS